MRPVRGRPADARLIAETARMRPDLALVTPLVELVADLTRMSAHPADVMADWVRTVNLLPDLLTSVFPALERTLDYSTRSALILVSGCHTPEAIRRADPAALSRYLRENGMPCPIHRPQGIAGAPVAVCNQAGCGLPRADSHPSYVPQPAAYSRFQWHLAACPDMQQGRQSVHELLIHLVAGVRFEPT